MSVRLPEGYVLVRAASHRALGKLRASLASGEVGHTFVSMTRPEVHAVPRTTWERVAAQGGNAGKGLSLAKRVDLSRYQRPIGGGGTWGG